jgi:hypothetical protein
VIENADAMIGYDIPDYLLFLNTCAYSHWDSFGRPKILVAKISEDQVHFVHGIKNVLKMRRYILSFLPTRAHYLYKGSARKFGNSVLGLFLPAEIPQVLTFCARQNAKKFGRPTTI